MYRQLVDMESFLSLPLELRNDIYKDCLVTLHYLTPFSPPSEPVKDYPDMKEVMNALPGAGLLGTNQQIRHEAEAIFYQYNTFVLHIWTPMWDVRHSLDDMPAIWRDHLHLFWHVRIKHSDQELHPYEKSLVRCYTDSMEPQVESARSALQEACMRTWERRLFWIGQMNLSTLCIEIPNPTRFYPLDLLKKGEESFFFTQFWHQSMSRKAIGSSLEKVLQEIGVPRDALRLWSLDSQQAPLLTGSVKEIIITGLGDLSSLRESIDTWDKERSALHDYIHAQGYRCDSCDPNMQSEILQQWRKTYTSPEPSEPRLEELPGGSSGPLTKYKAKRQRSWELEMEERKLFITDPLKWMEDAGIKAQNARNLT